MLDRKFVIENADAVLQNCENRNVSSDVSKIVELETQRREKLQEAEKLNAEANATSKKIGGAKDDAERESLKEGCLLYTSPSPRDGLLSRMPSSA